MPDRAPVRPIAAPVIAWLAAEYRVDDSTGKQRVRVRVTRSEGNGVVESYWADCTDLLDVSDDLRHDDRWHRAITQYPSTGALRLIACRMVLA